MGTVNSSCRDKPFSNEGYATPETKYDLQNLTRATFPIRVNVFSSHHGGLLQDVMYQDIDVYFQKETRMLVAVSEDGRPRLIPFNSAVKCSVIDDVGAGADTGTCLHGRTFGSSDELMMASPLPKVVSSEHGFYHKDFAHTVERDDLMIIKKLQVDEASGKPCTLECREACTDEDRWIEKGIQCTFTTNANKITHVNPNFLFNHLILPVRIMLKLDDKDDAAMQPSMNDSFYTVTNVITKRSVVCSVRYSTGAKKLIEVYLDVPIEFEIIKLTELEMQKLRVEAWQVFNEFSSSQVGRVVVNPADEIQSMLLHATRMEDESGITLLPPEPSFSKVFPAFLTKRVSAQRKKSIKEGVPIGSKGVLKKKLRESEAPMQCSSEKLVRKKSSVNYGKLLSGVWTEKTLGFASSEDISQTVPNDHDYVDMDVGVSTPNIAADKMETIVENNQERKHLNKNEAAPIADEFDQSLVASENRKILLRYTSKDVLVVLSRLRLSQYRDVFDKEAITGSLLLDLHDESILIELGMNSRLHQLKIQRLLDGRESVRTLMKNETLL